MKLFASILASILLLQVSTPVFCMTERVAKYFSSSSCCAENKNHAATPSEACKPMSTVGTDHECTLSASNGLSVHKSESHACTDCTIPNCSAPVFGFFCEEATPMNFELAPLSNVTISYPESGIPHDGFLNNAFQPPERT